MQEPPPPTTSLAPASCSYRATLCWLFAFATLLYLFTAGSNFTSGDAYAELRVTQSLVEHGWFNEAPSPKCTVGSGYGEPGADGRCYATHGIGYSLLLLPGYLLARTVIRTLDVPYCDTWTYCVPIHLVSWTTCLLGALTVALLCRLCIDLGYDVRRSVLVALLYGFASLAWPYARYGFDVTPTALFLLAAVREALLAQRSEGSERSVARWFRSGVFSAIALTIRLPTAAALLPLVVYVVLGRRDLPRWRGARACAAFALPLVAGLAWSAWFNHVRFGSILNDGHVHNAAESLTSMPWLGVLGTTISSGKGLLWYCPISILALFAVPGFYRRFPAECTLLLGMVIASLIPYMVVRDWYGGDAWGPRFFVPVLPLLLVPLVELPAVIGGRLNRYVLSALICLAGVGLALAGQLVSYPERLRLAAMGGTGDRIFWDPRFSPIGDHLSTLVYYVAHPGDTLRTTGQGASSFDIWWLNLWRNDQVPLQPVLAAGACALLLTLLAWGGLLRSLRAAADHSAPH